jgi:molybdopterin/thiamine biosynthesis adenylyltransferase
MSVGVVPIARDLQRVCDVFGGGQIDEAAITDVEGRDLPTRRVVLAGGLEFLCLFSEYYPALPPLLLVTAEEAVMEHVALPWSIHTPEQDRLVEGLSQVLKAGGRHQKVYGPVHGKALTADATTAHLAGWPARFSGEDVAQNARDIQAGLLARSQGLLSDAISTKHVLVAGVGSVGSYLTEQLARSGVGHFTVLDPDVVEPANLSRTIYDATDIDRPKVEALARRLFHVNPLLSLTLHPSNVLDVQPEALDAWVRAVDLVVAATDDQQAQRALNHFAYAHGKPALFVGLYAGAQGGEVVLSVPERTPCYLCATFTRHQYNEAGGRVAAETAEGTGQLIGERDYGTGQLTGETAEGTGQLTGAVALGVDVQHVTSAAVKLALALLVAGHPELQLSGFVDAALDAGLTYLTLAMVPNYWFYPHLFKDIPGQHAYQSVWLSPGRRPDCAVCGASSFRSSPLAVPLRGPQLNAIRQEIGENDVTAQS